MVERANSQSDAWAVFMPGQAITAVNLLTPPLGAMAAASAIGIGVASQMWGLWAGAVAGAFDANIGLKVGVTEQPRTAGGNVDELKTIIRGKVARAPARVIDATVAEAQVVPVAVAEAKATPAEQVATSDDLKRISGVGPKLEQVLNGMGIRTYAQIAAWQADDIARVDDTLKFGGRILRDDWVGQAKSLMGKP